jgi:hypothetical protein
MVESTTAIRYWTGNPTCGKSPKTQYLKTGKPEKFTKHPRALIEKPMLNGIDLGEVPILTLGLYPD